jgi:hypothetical protein
VESSIEQKRLDVRCDAGYAAKIEALVKKEPAAHRNRQERDRARALKRRVHSTSNATS